MALHGLVSRSRRGQPPIPRGPKDEPASVRLPRSLEQENARCGHLLGTGKQILPDAEGFSFLTSGRTVGHLERSPDRVVFPQNDAANRCNPPSSALVAKERPNGAAERSVR